MLDEVLWLIVIEMLEPLCSLWMLLTAAARIEQLQCRHQDSSRVGVVVALDRSWKVSAWALIILCHYSFGITFGLL